MENNQLGFDLLEIIAEHGPITLEEIYDELEKQGYIIENREEEDKNGSD